MSFRYDGKSRPPNEAFDKGMDRIVKIRQDGNGNEIKCSTCKNLGNLEHCTKYCVEDLDGWQLEEK